jgi:hypothetical protein
MVGNKMIWFLLFVTIVLVSGPLRRPFFRHWTFCLPGTVMAFVIWFVVSALKRPWDPWWVVPVAAIVGGLIAGGTCKEYLDQLFRKEH